MTKNTPFIARVNGPSSLTPGENGRAGHDIPAWFNSVGEAAIEGGNTERPA
jgi:hypothetical protein